MFTRTEASRLFGSNEQASVFSETLVTSGMPRKLLLEHYGFRSDSDVSSVSIDLNNLSEADSALEKEDDLQSLEGQVVSQTENGVKKVRFDDVRREKSLTPAPSEFSEGFPSSRRKWRKTKRLLKNVLKPFRQMIKTVRRE